MKEEKIEKYWEEDETVEMNIEDLTEIQGGIDDNETGTSGTCGLGCFIREASIE